MNNISEYFSDMRERYDEWMEYDFDEFKDLWKKRCRNAGKATGYLGSKILYKSLNTGVNSYLKSLYATIPGGIALGLSASLPVAAMRTITGIFSSVVWGISLTQVFVSLPIFLGGGAVIGAIEGTFKGLRGIYRNKHHTYFDN